MRESTIHRLEPRTFYYTFGPNEPALTVKSGDVVVARTRDAGGFNEKMEPMPEEMKQRNDATLLCERNPQVGPVYVEGAEPGDVLAATIQQIKHKRG
ncbi:MAG: acetamidase/formamidase family protein, partial [Dehalococcoidia bacterium]|nr:acetamidase/formamidase family protein [Dehalococcoidia bacterium]